MYKETKSGLSSLIYTGEQRVWPTLFVSLDLSVYYREANSVTYSSTCLYTIGGERVWSHSFAPYIYTGVTTTLTLFDSLYIYREQKSVPTLFGPL